MGGCGPYKGLYPARRGASCHYPARLSAALDIFIFTQLATDEPCVSCRTPIVMDPPFMLFYSKTAVRCLQGTWGAGAAQDLLARSVTEYAGGVYIWCVYKETTTWLFPRVSGKDGRGQHLTNQRAGAAGPPGVYKRGPGLRTASCSFGFRETSGLKGQATAPTR